MEIQSAPGAGTTIEVLMPSPDAEVPVAPASDNGADARRRDRPRGRGRGGGAPPDLPNPQTRWLQRLEAPDGPRAIETWDEYHGAIDLLLTDVVMPGMSGKDLADRLGIEPVFVSGYTDDVISRHGMDGVRLVQKPFDAQTLLGAIRSALDA